MKEFSEELVKRYKKWVASDTEYLYNKFREELDKHLKGKAQDPIEIGKLIVELYRITK